LKKISIFEKNSFSEPLEESVVFLKILKRISNFQKFSFSESSLRMKRQHTNGNRLDIKPSGPHHKPVGKNLFFTCKSEVSNPQLVRSKSKGLFTLAKFVGETVKKA
jgi:hypothetical protein